MPEGIGKTGGEERDFATFNNLAQSGESSHFASNIAGIFAVHDC